MGNTIPQGWFTPGSRQGTWQLEGIYGLIPFSALPEIDRRLFDGTFSWLATLPATRYFPLGFNEMKLKPIL